jgi:hypothetical protein
VIDVDKRAQNTMRDGKRSPRRRYASPQVVRLIERIKGLVDEQRRVEQGGGRADALRREIGCLQERLARVVRRELNEGAPLPSS